MSLIPALQLASLPWDYCIVTTVLLAVSKVFVSAPRAGRYILPPTLPACKNVYFDRKPARSNVSTTSVSNSKLVSCWESPPSSRQDGGECLIALAEAILSKWRNKEGRGHKAY